MVCLSRRYPFKSFKGRIHRTYLVNSWILYPNCDATTDTRNISTEYRGITTDHFLKRLKSIGAPAQPVLTICKIRICLPSLKSKIEENLKSRAVYKIVCPRCNANHVGQTSRFLITRFQEQRYKRNEQVRAYFDKFTHCATILNDAKILASTSCSLNILSILETLYREVKLDLIARMSITFGNQSSNSNL